MLKLLQNESLCCFCCRASTESSRAADDSLIISPFSPFRVHSSFLHFLPLFESWKMEHSKLFLLTFSRALLTLESLGLCEAGLLEKVQTQRAKLKWIKHERCGLKKTLLDALLGNFSFFGLAYFFLP